MLDSWTKGFAFFQPHVALKDRRLVRLLIENGLVSGEEHLLTDRGQRMRDVRQGSAGALYVVTDETNGELWKIIPRR